MFKKSFLPLLILLLTSVTLANAQHIAVSNNLVFDIAGALSAGVEIPCSKSTSIDLYGSIRPWQRSTESVHKHWLVQGQYRLWPCQLMNGFFFGPYVHAGEFNIGNSNLFFGLLPTLENNRYEGWLAGAGLGCGYEYALARHWNLGAEIGVGYTYIDRKKSECQVCGPLTDDDVYHYVGISRLGLSIIYVF